ncbi:flagellar biosynthesis protein FlhB [Butyrivibrio fibrisolvens]|uniref:flagellar biosynthesis protein FlhB n=1 Tax=Butyrivibrio fibrisolvens TaxID=831 RepID=UPI0004024E05|nr:flagellar biosynthesis protein FlhB [Butyrivibrio fibrisolvens]
MDLRLRYDLQFFAKEGPGGEKTEEATGKRLNDARKKGQVAKSQEITVAADLFAFFIILSIYKEYLGTNFVFLFNDIYGNIPDTIVMVDGYIPKATFDSLFVKIIIIALITVLPYLIAGFALALICNIVQFGFKITTEPMKPKFNKLNPLSGIKRIFSVQSLFNLVKSLMKIGLISIVVYVTLTGRNESLFLLYDMPLRQGIALMGDIIIDLGLRCAFVYLIIAAADFIYQKHKFREDMKMTKQEVKDEYKDTEGDPQIKSKQKQKMREASQRRMMKELPKADVVITNPTHYAVALVYNQDEDPAPKVIAKGADYVAMKIKEAAKENHIEIVEDKPLARMLYANVEIGEYIPPELYKAVAEVLAYVYKLQGKI